MSQPPVPDGGNAATGVPTCYRHPARETYISCQRCGRPICPDCMRDAAVGFQCPTCVAEGAKTMRQGRTAYGGRRSADPQQTTLGLIAINVAVWLMIMATGGGGVWVERLALRPRGFCVLPDGSARAADESACAAAGATWVDGVSSGSYWQLLTSAFTHLEIWHLAVNLLSLWLIGPLVENVLGRARFLTLYLVSALSGSLFVYWLSAEYGATVGASGALFGLMGALLVFAHKVGGNVQQILFVLLINGVITFSYARISWQGHLGGFLGGLAVAAVLAYAPKPRRTTWQVAGVAAILLLILAGLAARTLVLT